MAYLRQEINPTDGYRADAETPFFSAQQAVIASLYQPLIGSNAAALYAYLHQQVGQDRIYLISHLLSVMNFGVSDFYEARIRLEGLGLLETYRKSSENIYIYHLKEPLTAHDFFRHEILGFLLMEQVGEQNFKYLQEQFKPQLLSKVGYQNITRSFTDVYRFNSSVDSMQNFFNQQPTEKKAMSPIKLTDSAFNWDLFIAEMKGQYIKNGEWERQEVKDTVILLHEMYGYNELDMQALVLDASDLDSGEIDVKKLKNSVRKKEAQRNVQIVPRKNPTSTPEADIATSVTAKRPQAEAALIAAANANSAIAFLDSIKKQKGGYVASNEYFALEELVGRSGLSTPVVNILIHYILVVGNNATLNQKYANTIANSWAQDGVKTPEDAIQKVKDLAQEAKTKLTNKPRYNQQPRLRQEVVPEWAKKEAKKEPPANREVAPQIETQNFKDRLKEIRGGGKEDE